MVKKGGSVKKQDEVFNEDKNVATGTSIDIKSKYLNQKPLHSEEDFKQRENQEKAQVVRAEYIAAAVRDRNICKELIDPDPLRYGLDRFGQIKQKLDKYQTEKGALPNDSDGVYLIVKGIARIQN